MKECPHSQVQDSEKLVEVLTSILSMEAGRTFHFLTLLLALLNTGFNMTKFRVKMLYEPSYREFLPQKFDVPRDIFEDYSENEHPPNPYLGNYLVREKHFPCSNNLANDEVDQEERNRDIFNRHMIKENQEIGPYQEIARQDNDQLFKVDFKYNNMTTINYIY